VLSLYGTVYLIMRSFGRNGYNILKRRLDKFWTDQDVMYNYKA